MLLKKYYYIPSGSREGKCPVCTRQYLKCGKSCDTDSDCDWPQKCCQQDGCAFKVCLDPILDYYCGYNKTLFRPGDR